MDFQDPLAYNGGFVGQNRERGGANATTVTPNKLVFTFVLGVLTSVPILAKIDKKQQP